MMGLVTHKQGKGDRYSSLSLSLQVHTLWKGHVKTYQEGGYPQYNERLLTRNQIGQYLDLGLDNGDKTHF